MHGGGTRQRIEVSSPAKINLYFELLGKRDDGFHEVETVMSTVSLSDHLVFTPRDDGEICLELISEGPLDEPIPVDGRNLVVQALQQLRSFADPKQSGVPQSPVNSSFGMDVVLTKRIPAAAGLGGASSNAAAALIAGNEIWGAGLDLTQLQQLAGTIGSDVPFFLVGGVAVCRGRGEIIEPIAGPASMPILIVKPLMGLSTADVYRQAVVPGSPSNVDPMVKALAVSDVSAIGQALRNRLRLAADRLTDVMRGIELAFHGMKCVGHQMSGSGSAYFGLFHDLGAAEAAADAFANQMPEVATFVCHTTGPMQRELLTGCSQG